MLFSWIVYMFLHVVPAELSTPYPHFSIFFFAWWKQRRSFYVVHDVSIDDVSSDHRDYDEDDDQEKNTIRESSFNDDEVEVYNSTSFDPMNDDKEKIRRMSNVTSSMITSSQCQQNSNTRERSRHHTEPQQQVPDDVAWSQLRMATTNVIYPYPIPPLLRHEHHIA
jgi:hypothetical protein